MHVIPSIDLRSGRCVRLRQGRFDEVTEYGIDPLKQAETYALAGFRRVHLVDLDGCLEGRPVNAGIIEDIAAINGLRLQAGGGIRDWDSVIAYLDAGIDRVVIGSMALRSPAEVAGWMQELGPEHFVIAADVRLENGTPRALVDGWRSEARTGLYATLGYLAQQGMREMLCTDVARDGMLAGPSVGFYEELCGRFPAVAIQASGGVRDEHDLKELERAGAHAAIVGKSLLDGVMKLEQIGQWAPAE